jgi:hypothetical protein
MCDAPARKRVCAWAVIHAAAEIPLAKLQLATALSVQGRGVGANLRASVFACLLDAGIALAFFGCLVVQGGHAVVITGV